MISYKEGLLLISSLGHRQGSFLNYKDRICSIIEEDYDRNMEEIWEQLIADYVGWGINESKRRN